MGNDDPTLVILDSNLKIMEMGFSSNGLILTLLGTIICIGCIILFFRHRLHRANPAALRQKHLAAGPMDALTFRNKYPEVDVFKYSGYFLKFGLLSSIFLVFATMNLTEEGKDVIIPDQDMSLSEDIEIEVPRSAEPPPPPPPPPPVIAEIPDNLILDEDQPEFLDQSIETETKVFAPAPQVNKPAPPPAPPPPPRQKEDEIFVIAEDMPRFPGCEELGTKKDKEECAKQKLLEFIYGNIKYPAIARENGVMGTVVIAFVVEKNGEVRDAKIVRDIGGGCGDEALRVVNLMNSQSGPWMPGKQRGQSVRVQFNLPVKFQLK